ncbi:hypothetical protein [Tindallia californiensis]|uniref:Uncharacterized protein n=1 Tax=Tindallia californiensis TaxID=159292 RepID=A0A1H3QJ11_9FIRM|nr:hypothetical protein [Tindallia californiensis]SDZ12975.1 hypothetical protein SAMN05192546_10998 [Tindallia californiensis]
MKKLTLDRLKLYIWFHAQYKKVRSLLYVMAVITIAIPVFMILIDEGVTFSPLMGNIIINVSSGCFILGKLITLYDKWYEEQPVSFHVAFILGTLLVVLKRG